MIYYWILFITEIILCNVSHGKNNEKATLILSLALLFLFVAFREGFTPDYYNYEDVFNLYHNNVETDDSYGDEIGFQMLCMILPSYRMLLVIHTLLYCVCAFVAIATFVPKDKYHIAFVAMFCIIPFLLGNMTGMRSGFVSCFFFLAILVKGRYENWLGLAMAFGIVFLSTYMHTSALALIPLLLFPIGPQKKYIVNTVFVASAILIIATTLIPQMLNQWITDLTNNFFEESHYDLYLQNNVVVESGFSFFSIIHKACLFYMLYVMVARIQTEKDHMINLCTKYAVIFLLLCMLPSSAIGVSRFQYYFAFPAIIAIPNILKNSSGNAKMFFILSLTYYIFYQLRLFMQSPITLRYYMFYDNILF